jgi:hypothetical protein
VGWLSIMRCSAAFCVRVEREPVAEPYAGEVLMGEQDRNTPSAAAAADGYLGVGDAVDIGVGFWWRQRVAGLCAVADRLDGGLVQPYPPTVAEDVTGLCVRVLGQDAGPTGADRPPPLTEGGRDLGALPLKLWIAVRAGCHGEMIVQFPQLPAIS